MKLLITLLFFSGNISVDSDIALLRNLYVSAATSEDKAIQLIQESKKDKNNVTYKGYCGAGKMLMAKYYSNPISKLNSFNNGKEILESAIRSDKINPELRYLRLTIQKNSPPFLGYNKNIDKDKMFLSTSLPSIKDEQLKTIIKNYLKTY